MPTGSGRFAPLVIGEQPPSMDNATWRRLRAGRLPAERSLDLHGHTAQRAYHTLETWLRAARADGVRVVEIITGHGAGEAGGVLKREVPLWLNLPNLRPFILGAAHPHIRNTGAVRLLLRK
jgi:DNA-nicking Smr family endonuclease